MLKKSSAPGKIILAGEYGGRILGHPAVLIPASVRLTASLEPGDHFKLAWPEIEGRRDWPTYIRDILLLISKQTGLLRGTLRIENTIPLGKGMGSSTALVIALSRLFLGDDSHEEALTIEETVNPGHSGMDFSVIWHNRPIFFSADGGGRPIALDEYLLAGGFLVDTGPPAETTPELVAWVKSRKEESREASALIANCTERLLSLVSLGPAAMHQALIPIMRDHHRAQCALGVVPAPVQTLIASIEEAGGAAKVIGAGGRKEGAGMVLAIGISQDKISRYPVISL